jgi:ABC-type lipoprotein release transport system permease subunit
VVRRGLTLTALGVTLGLGAAVFASRVLDNLVFGVSPTDPLVYAAVSAALLVTGVAASWIPARDAGRTRVVECLRDT